MVTAQLVCDHLAWEGKTYKQLLRQRWQLVELACELERCAADADSAEALQSYRDEWMEVMASVYELRCMMAGFALERPVVPQVFARFDR